MEKFKPASGDLGKDEVQGLFKKEGRDEVICSVLMLDGEDKEAAFALWLNARIKRDCYYFCTVYRFMVWATTDKAGKEKIVVNELRLKISRKGDRADYEMVRSNESECVYIKEVYGRENTSHPTLLTGTAKLFGRSWVVEVSL